MEGRWRVVAFSWVALAGVALAGGWPVGSGEPGWRLLKAMDTAEGLQAAGWQMQETVVEMSPSEVKPRAGSAALRFRGDARVPGAKGDFHIFSALPEGLRKLALWVHLDDTSNVKLVGFQLFDAQGEGLLVKVPADWDGWKRLEIDLDSAAWEQAWVQPEHDGVLDQPVRAVNLVWFTREAGPSHLDVDELAAVFGPQAPLPAPLTLEMPADAAPGAPLPGVAVLHNSSAEPSRWDVRLHLLSNPQLEEVPVPDPKHGLDVARGAKSWTLAADGGYVEDGSLTDGLDFTNFETGWRNEGQGELRQRVDLGAQRRVTKLAIYPTDGNWIWKVEVSASRDGESFEVLRGLEAVDLHKKHQGVEVELQPPQDVRFLQLRYFKEDGPPARYSLPRKLEVFAGSEESDWEVPVLGGVAGEQKAQVELPPSSYALLPLNSLRLPGPGAYLLRATVSSPTQKFAAQRHVFSSVEPHPPANAAASRFGINGSSPALAHRWGPHGFGWMRFENMKWAFISPRPGEYYFDGRVGPWHVNHDELLRAYHEAGLRVLPYVFIVPEYATTAGPEVKKLRDAHPPQDPAMYAEAVFQIVARYGSRKVEESKLLTPDKLSGLGLIHAIEIWNEPNLNPRPDATWGAWAAPLEAFWPFFRAGAEAAKQADPSLPVTSPGMAGLTLEVVEPFRTHLYPDGKRPLDFMDILNVHYYSGRRPPETATVDRNVQRQGAPEGRRTYPDDLRELVEWRDQHAPRKPIWLTETGYDSTGSHGVGERLQAARLPRVMLLALAAGVDKVFMYRELGSTPSQHASSGLLRNDGSPKPSYFSLATMLRELDGLESGPAVRWPDPDPNIWAFAWNTPRGLVLTAWTVEGSAQLNLGQGTCEVVDSFGGRSRADASSLQVGEFPIYIYGATEVAGVKERLAEAQLRAQDERARRKREAERQAWLFDFGTAEHTGLLRGYGPARPFRAVTGDMEFTSERGYGFEGLPVRASDRPWIADALERDHCRLENNKAFVADIPLGTYELSLSAAAVGSGEAILVLENASAEDGSAAEFRLDPQPKTYRAIIQVLGMPLRVRTTGFADLYWLALVEKR